MFYSSYNKQRDLSSRNWICAAPVCQGSLGSWGFNMGSETLVTLIQQFCHGYCEETASHIPISVHDGNTSNKPICAHKHPVIRSAAFLVAHSNFLYAIGHVPFMFCFMSQYWPSKVGLRHSRYSSGRVLRSNASPKYKQCRGVPQVVMTITWQWILVWNPISKHSRNWD